MNSSFRRFLRPLLTSLGGLAIMLGLNSCLLKEIKIFFQGELKRGLPNQNFSFSCDAAELEAADFSRPIVVRFLEEDDGTPVTGVVVSGPVVVGDIPLFTEFHTKVDVAANVPAHWVKLEATFSVKDQPFGIIKAIGRALISSVDGPPPPDITEVVAAEAEGARSRGRAANGLSPTVPAIPRGVATRLEFIGTDFDASAQILAENPAVIVSDVAFDEDTGSVFGTITTPLNGPTGRSRLFIRTTGGDSPLTEIAVRAAGGGGGGTPALTRPFPNVIAANTSTEVTLAGQNLEDATVRIDPPNALVSVSSESVDANTLRATFDVQATVSVITITVYADSPGGTSAEPLTITIVPPGSPVPRITAVVEDFITAGISTGKQLRITGTNLGGGSPISVIHLLPNPNVPEKSTGFTFIAPSDPSERNNSVIVSLGILPFDDDDVLVSGVAEFALERADGQTTNVLELSIQSPPPPTDGRPFIAGLSPLSVARGETSKQISLSGVRLTGLTTVDFEQAGITVTNIASAPNGFTATLTVDVAANAVLTDTATTNFEINSNHGTTPKVGLIVTP